MAARKVSTKNNPQETDQNMEEAKKVVLDRALHDIIKKYGDGSIMRLGEAHHMQVEAIPTGSLSLDMALGVGGIPKARITEIYGPESSGKTTLCQHIVAECQAQGGTAAYIDMEHALDPIYAAKCGVKTDQLLISQPDTGEQALEIAETLVRSGCGASTRSSRSPHGNRRRHGRPNHGCPGAPHVPGAAQALGCD